MGRKNNLKKRIIYSVVCFTLFFQQMGFAQVAGELNIAGYLAGMHSGISIDKFRPLHLRYFSYDLNSDNFKFLFDKGDLKQLEDGQFKEQSAELLKYFLIGITLPDSKFWVNLRPDSEDQIIEPELEQTDMGKVLLEADLQLKKDTAKYTSPETPEGREYWNRLYKKAEELFGYEAITIPTLTRPWIVPGEIIVRETSDSSFIYKSTLKVMLEQDYLKDSVTYSFKDERMKALNEYSSQLIRELIIPKLTKEVNISKKYAPLRQVFYSLILSRWFKARYAGKSSFYASLIDSRNLNGLTSKESWSKTTYFKEYQKSFNDGEYNIKEPVYTPTGQVIRSYFSGGVLPIPTNEQLTGMVGGEKNYFGANPNLIPGDSSIIPLQVAGSPIEKGRKNAQVLSVEQIFSNELARAGLTSDLVDNYIVSRDNLIFRGREYIKKFMELLPSKSIRFPGGEAEMFTVTDHEKKAHELNFYLIKSEPGVSTKLRGLCRIKISPGNDIQVNVDPAVIPPQTSSKELAELADTIVSGLTFEPPTAGSPLTDEQKRIANSARNIFNKIKVLHFYPPQIKEDFLQELNILQNNVKEAFKDEHKLLYPLAQQLLAYIGSSRMHMKDELVVSEGTRHWIDAVNYVLDKIKTTLEEISETGVIPAAGSPIKDEKKSEEIASRMQHWRAERALEAYRIGDISFEEAVSELIAVGIPGEEAELIIMGKKGGAAGSPMTAPDTTGGIDFRVMNIVTQPLVASSSLSLKLPQLANLTEINLDEEFQQLQNMLSAGITPSGERIKEYLAACQLKGEWDKRIADIISCLIEVCRLEEDNVSETPLEIKEALIIADSGNLGS